MLLLLLALALPAFAHDKSGLPIAEDDHGAGFPWWLMRRYEPPTPLSTDPADTAGSVVAQTPDWVTGPADRVVPSQVHFTYTAAGAGIDAGGSLKVMLGHVLPTAQRIYTPFSLSATSAYFFKINLLDEVEAVASDPSVRLRVVEPRGARSFGQILSYVRYKRTSDGEATRDGLLRQIDNEYAVRIEVVRGRLDPGETISVTFGARKGLAPPKSEASWEIVTRVDGDGNGTWGILPSPPSFDAYSRDTQAVVAIAPTSLYPGQTSRMVVHPQDGYFLPNLPRIESGSVRLDPLEGLTFPLDATFSGGLEEWDGSLVEVPVTAATPGVYRITGTATIDGKAFPIRSNPIEVVPEGSPRVYFGDLHLHSILSFDADRPPTYVYWRQRYQERHDFAALSDHDMIGAVPMAKRSGVSGRTPDEWAYAKQLGNEWNDPGEFATLLAYEWTSYYFGHRNIFFAAEEEDPPMFHHNQPADHLPGDERSPGELRDSLAGDGGHRYIAIPHSSAWPTKDHRYHWGSGTNPDGHSIGDPTAWPEQRLVEIYSTHGGSEYFDNENPVDKGHPEVPVDSKLIKNLLNYDIQQAAPESGNFVRDALGAGWRFGFVGASDDHYLSHLDQAYKYGYAAVFAPALTRKDIWEGLNARGTYAVTGARILLHLAANGAPMGSFIQVKNGAVHFVGSVHGVGPLDRVEIARFDGVTWSTVYSADLDGALDHAFDTTDSSAKPGNIYYLRARQQDGNRAWSSPVWVQ